VIINKSLPLIAVVGATASGKTEFAIALAKKINGEIISGDSRQIYQGLDLGTGNPSLQQLQAVPHYLISTHPLNQTVTAAQFAREADEYHQRIQAKGKYTLVVGGTGLWIQAMIDGLADLPKGDDKFRTEMKKLDHQFGPGFLYERLKKIDSEAAEKIGPTNTVRLIRALEIAHLTGEKPTQLWKDNKSKAKRPSIWFGMDVSRETLYEHCEIRIDHWIAQGWVEEVKTLLKDKDLILSQPALKAIGILSIQQYLQQEISLERCVEIIKRDTRRYIKRQLTWFNKNKRIIWIKPEDVELAVQHVALQQKEMTD